MNTMKRNLTKNLPGNTGTRARAQYTRVSQPGRGDALNLKWRLGLARPKCCASSNPAFDNHWRCIRDHLTLVPYLFAGTLKCFVSLTNAFLSSLKLASGIANGVSEFQGTIYGRNLFVKIWNYFKFKTALVKFDWLMSSISLSRT